MWLLWVERGCVGSWCGSQPPLSLDSSFSLPLPLTFYLPPRFLFGSSFSPGPALWWIGTLPPVEAVVTGTQAASAYQALLTRVTRLFSGMRSGQDSTVLAVHLLDL